MSTPKKPNKRLFIIAGLTVLALVVSAGIAIRGFFPRELLVKAKASEPQTLLSAVHTAEKAYFKEYKRYTIDTLAAGYTPESLSRYFVGFSEQCEQKPNDALVRLGQMQLEGNTRTAIMEAFMNLPCNSDFETHYTAYAVGNVHGDKVEIWSIDEKGDLKQLAQSHP